MTTLVGYDSVTADAMPDNGDFYCFYSTGSFANGTAVKADHPDKKYIGITPTISDIAGADCLDIENGDATPADAPTFVKNADPSSLNLPMLYASESNVAAVISACTAAGIARDKYYIFQALWNGVAAVPAGVDAAQYQNTPGYDNDIALSYVFKGSTPTPVVTTGTQRGWAWCTKCAGLFFPNSSKDACPAGGKHDGNGSYDYSLEFSTAPKA